MIDENDPWMRILELIEQRYLNSETLIWAMNPTAFKRYMETAIANIQLMPFSALDFGSDDSEC